MKCRFEIEFDDDKDEEVLKAYDDVDWILQHIALYGDMVIQNQYAEAGTLINDMAKHMKELQEGNVDD